MKCVTEMIFKQYLCQVKHMKWRDKLSFHLKKIATDEDIREQWIFLVYYFVLISYNEVDELGQISDTFLRYFLFLTN